MRIIFIRHAESLANVDGRFYNMPDVANILSEKGVAQALAVEEKMRVILRNGPGALHTTVISSTMQRAKLTADIAMNGHGLPILRDSRINECPEDSLGYVIETPNDVVNRIRSLVNQHAFELILFTHCHLMLRLLGGSKPKNGEIRIFDRTEFIKDYLN